MTIMFYFTFICKNEMDNCYMRICEQRLKLHIIKDEKSINNSIFAGATIKICKTINRTWLIYIQKYKEKMNKFTECSQFGYIVDTNGLYIY